MWEKNVSFVVSYVQLKILFPALSIVVTGFQPLILLLILKPSGAFPC